METLMAELYGYICDNTPPPRNNPEYQQAVQAYTEIEAEVKEKIGADLLSQYRCADLNVTRQEDLAIFSQTIRLFYRFMLELLRD